MTGTGEEDPIVARGVTEARRVAKTLAAVGALVVAGCTSHTDPSHRSNSSDRSFGSAPVVLTIEEALDAADGACGPEGRDRLYVEAGTHDPASAARWYSDRFEPEWQVLVEEACYLALVNAGS